MNSARRQFVSVALSIRLYLTRGASRREYSVTVVVRRACRPDAHGSAGCKESRTKSHRSSGTIVLTVENRKHMRMTVVASDVVEGSE